MTGQADDPSGWRLPAAKLEHAIRRCVQEHFKNGLDSLTSIEDPIELYRAQDRLTDLRAQLEKPSPDLLRTLIAQVHLAPSSIRIELDPAALSEVTGVGLSSWREAALEVKSAFELRRRGVEIKLMTGSFEPERDKTLIRAIAKAHQWLGEARKGVPLAAIGRRYGWTDSPIRQRIRLAFLAPQITTAILEGRQPPELTLQYLLTNPLPLDWTTQAESLGFNRKTLPVPE